MLKVYQPEDENVGFARSHEQGLDFDRIRLKTLTTDNDLSVLTSNNIRRRKDSENHMLRRATSIMITSKPDRYVLSFDFSGIDGGHPYTWFTAVNKSYFIRRAPFRYEV